jgi:hypothetical protein
LNTDKKNTRLLAQTFFAQLRAGGYTPTQIIGVATELLDLVTEGIKENGKGIAAQTTQESRPGFRQEA